MPVMRRAWLAGLVVGALPLKADLPDLLKSFPSHLHITDIASALHPSFANLTCLLDNGQKIRGSNSLGDIWMAMEMMTCMHHWAMGYLQAQHCTFGSRFCRLPWSVPALALPRMLPWPLQIHPG